MNLTTNRASGGVAHKRLWVRSWLLVPLAFVSVHLVGCARGVVAPSPSTLVQFMQEAYEHRSVNRGYDVTGAHYVCTFGVTEPKYGIYAFVDPLVLSGDLQQHSAPCPGTYFLVAGDYGSPREDVATVIEVAVLPNGGVATTVFVLKWNAASEKWELRVSKGRVPLPGP